MDFCTSDIASACQVRDWVSAQIARTVEASERRVAPAPLVTAPEGRNPPGLLSCPDQSGWHAAIWFYGKWLAAIDSSTLLNPTRGLPSPPESEEGDSTAARAIPAGA